MDVAEAYEVNSPNLKQKMLIATQGSKFKDSIVSEIIEQYKSDFIYIKVIDISTLANTNTSDFDAILLIHTWEIGKPPETIQAFMDKIRD